ncbi:zinc finger protein 287 [Protobothrops mucrosquamatus]|uniref:zinc finger protein 287 n=1 Tax=Protobothrops mucrosquamatus TaxID=103944 RepID=UPI0007757AD8|nr:zinc finger protein 287 [Protobothrops mucrosquamatus]
MEIQPLPSEGIGKGPSAILAGSCGEICARIGQQMVEEETIIHSDSQLWNFRSIQYQEAEGPRGLCSRLHDFCKRWLRPQKHTKAQMLDMVVLEQLLAILPLEMESWVRECGAETTSQAIALLEGFLLSQAEEQKEQVELQSRDPEGRRTPSNPPQLFIRRIRQEDLSQDTSGEKQRMDFPVLYGEAERMVEPPNQEGHVSFQEVAVYFSKQEWSLLDPDQKALHWEVMMENHRNVVYVGKRLLLPNQRVQEDVLKADSGCSCMEFGKTFTQRFHLISQKMTHTEEKPHKCMEHGNTFPDRSELTLHKRIHMGEAI